LGHCRQLYPADGLPRHGLRLEFFQKLLTDSYGWSNSHVAWAFSLAICFLGLAAAAGGALLPKLGPTRLALAGGILFSAGYLVAALALTYRSLPLLYLGYGLLGGTGLGLGYVTPVATVAKWFPDRRGFATGMVVMGFGFGALLMSKFIAPHMLQLFPGNLPAVFAAMGGLFLLLTIPAAAGIRNPPPGWQPTGIPLPVISATAPDTAAATRTVRDCILSGEFALLWMIFFCSITAGIAIIGFQSPLFQDICSKAGIATGKETLARYGATLIAVSSLFNGVGRFFWGGVSDRICRKATFRLLLGTQFMAFLILMQTAPPGSSPCWSATSSSATAAASAPCRHSSLTASAARSCRPCTESSSPPGPPPELPVHRWWR